MNIDDDHEVEVDDDNVACCSLLVIETNSLHDAEQIKEGASMKSVRFLFSSPGALARARI